MGLLYMAEGSAPSTPSSGQGVLYVKSADSLLYYKSDAGTEYLLALLVGGVVPPSKGGTGIVNNDSSTLTISGAYATTLTVTGSTALTLPTSGTVTALGNTTTGSGSTIVLGTSPTFTTSVIGSATMAVFNTVSTTVNAFGAATTLNIGNVAGTNIITGYKTAIYGDGTDVNSFRVQRSSANVARIDLNYYKIQKYNGSDVVDLLEINTSGGGLTLGHASYANTVAGATTFSQAASFTGYIGVSGGGTTTALAEFGGTMSAISAAAKEVHILHATNPILVIGKDATNYGYIQQVTGGSNYMQMGYRAIGDQIKMVDTGLTTIGGSGNYGLAVNGTGSFTKATAGDVITFTNAAASNKTGYLYSDASLIGLMNIAGAGAGEGILIGNSGHVYTNIGGVTKLDVTSSGLAVTGTGSYTGNLTLSSATAGILMGTAAGYGYVGNSSGAAYLEFDGPSHATTPNQAFLRADNYSFKTVSGSSVLTASASSVDVAGNLSVGTTGNNYTGFYLAPTALATTVQYAMQIRPTFNSAATAYGVGFYSSPTTAAAAFTLTNMIGALISVGTKGAGSTITNQVGMYIADQALGGTFNAGLQLNQSAGTGKWTIYDDGGANSALLGKVRIGSNTAPSATLDVTGTISASKTITAATGSDAAKALYVEGYPSGLETALFYRDNTDSQPVIVIRSDQATGSTYGTFIRVKDQANSTVGSIKASGVGTGDIILDGVTLSTLAVNGSPIARASSTGLAVTGQASISAASYLYLDGGGDTGIRESSANVIQFVAGGSAIATASANTVTVTGGSSAYALDVTGSATSGQAAIFTMANTTATTSAVDLWHKATSGDNVFQKFFTESAATVRGSISYNRGGGVTAYNTTSDYRAKDIEGSFSGSGEVIDRLRVYTGRMKGATISRPMLIAHEAQEIVPYSVTGEKDAEDDNGNPIYQQMDHQVLVPLLIAEVQSLRTRLAALEAAQ